MKSKVFKTSTATAACLLAAGCGSEAKETPPDSSYAGPLFAVTSIIGAGDETLSYISLLESLEPQDIDYGEAQEISGLADAWMHEGFLYVADGEQLSITKYAVKGKALVQEGTRLAVGSTGITDLGFWVNTFVSPTKAYLSDGVSKYVVWNPETMKLAGEIPFPTLEPKGVLEPLTSYTDRSVIVRDGRMYHPVYWADESYVEYSPESSIMVVDVETDEVVDFLEAPCPGLDHATEGADGTLYFSSWVFAPGGAATLGAASTCVAKIAPGKSAVSLAFDVKDVTGGREGGVFRYVGDGKGILSVLHPDRVPAEDQNDFDVVAFGPNWHFWSYDFAYGTAAEIDSIDWNAGAAYAAQADGRAFSLVPSGGYDATTVYDVTDPSDPQKVFDTQGWSLRLLELRH